MWIVISIILLLLFILFRRGQDKSDENEANDDQEQSNETKSGDGMHHREPSEYRLSASQILPTIAEENPVTLSPSNSNAKFTPYVTAINTISPPALGIGKIKYLLSTKKNYLHAIFRRI